MRIDLNADVGEGDGAADAAIVPLVSSANIACGGHAGDADTIGRTIALALEHGVAVGAHPGYPDRDGFGRRELDLPTDRLRGTLAAQLEAIIEASDRRGAPLAHVKAHGALYHRASTDRSVAALLAGLVARLAPAAALVGPPGSLIVAEGRAAGLATYDEGFADRAYEPDGRLRSRDRAGAVLEEPAAAAAQALAIARDGRVGVGPDTWLPLEVDTICLHGDLPGAPARVRAVRDALGRAGILVAAPDRRP